MCNKVLEERSDVPKAFFRRGEALMQLKDYELAMNDFQMVIDLDPENKAAKNKVNHSNQNQQYSVLFILSIYCWLCVNDSNGSTYISVLLTTFLLDIKQNVLTPFIILSSQVALCLQEIKAQKNRDKKIFANMFDKFARIDAKREEDFKRREKPVEISEWKDNKKDRKESETLTVKGDIQVINFTDDLGLQFFIYVGRAVGVINIDNKEDTRQIDSRE